MQEIQVWFPLGRSLGGGNSNPHQYSCWENPMDRGAWRAADHGVEKSQAQLKWQSAQKQREIIQLQGIGFSGYWVLKQGLVDKSLLILLLFLFWETMYVFLEAVLTIATKVKMLVTQSCPTVFDPKDYNLCPWDSSGKNTGVGCHSLLQGISLTQGLNSSLPHCSQILYHLSHQGSPTNAIVL